MPADPEMEAAKDAALREKLYNSAIADGISERLAAEMADDTVRAIQNGRMVGRMFDTILGIPT